MLCPKCEESNPDNFRFCGMCGAVLGTAKPAAPRAVTPRPEPPSVGEVPIALRIAANPRRDSASGERVPLSGGPSLLGLGHTTAAPTGPSIDTLRDKAFSGTMPTFVYDDAKPGRGRTVLLLFILAILVAGVYVRYRYLGGGGDTAKPAATQTAVNPNPVANDQQKQPTSAASVPPAQAAAPPIATAPEKSAEKPAENTSAKRAESAPKQEAGSRPVGPPAPAGKQPAKSNGHTVPANMTAKPVAVAVARAPATDNGDAAYRKGDAYLYGRGGVGENCDQAIKNLKAASAAGNAKARSAFGTMYATGHCVPRDLPTSYSWFAKALQADPNNVILEKDLTAVWNQMTPPERQLATKIKQ